LYDGNSRKIDLLAVLVAPCLHLIRTLSSTYTHLCSHIDGISQAVVGGKSGIADMETLVLITDELLHGKKRNSFISLVPNPLTSLASMARCFNSQRVWCPLGNCNLISRRSPFPATAFFSPPSFLPEERMAKEAAATATREAAEAAIGATEEEREAAMLEELKALDAKYAAKAMEGMEGADEEAKMKAAASAAAAEKANAEIAEAKAEEDRVKAEAAKLEELMRQLDMSSDEEDD
jgi:hypothetical protein